MNELACVFGSTGGISKAISNQFTDEGWEYALISRNQLTANWSSGAEKLCYPDFSANTQKIRNTKDISVNAVFLTHVPQQEKSTSQYFSANIDLLKKSLDFLSECNVSMFLFASSSAVYGTRRDISLRETTTPNPENVYGELKLLSEQFLLDEFKGTLPTLKILRIFNVYGSGMTNSFINKIHDSLPNQELTFLGTSNFKRDYVDVSDVAESVKLAIKASGSGNNILNIASGDSISNAELANWVACHKQLRIKQLTCKDSFSKGDPTLAFREIQFRNRTSVWDYLNSSVK